ncbi:hypothetical protein MGYG_05711 [Nannizzia gypsea CBS 118893]|uniref:Heterokaryon incompatibility domain-containing protein n=1 Tax=Arthroderma gypseum (strain ATCC MYA-4604 / CBS 118893) TaxID=535722 RepID=E4UXH9_ARTGP|nr:hypothetical protein MGYG_05711 [Nannizzia gypsea CBS 118893]EFR02713.1 hypothetical protein MGYG_05711 [Nannizzia gypsea CBS 118893]
MPASVVQTEELWSDDHTLLQSGTLQMPIINTTIKLGPSNIYDDFVHGPQFVSKYERSLARPAQANSFPSRLVGPDGASHTTCEPYPDYVVISYTWGRWKHKNRDLDTPVNGGHWNVPANSLFTREDLDLAIRRIANGSHAWVDVLCIPQIEGDQEHAEEIGKQSEIFRSASRAAVWLCSGGEKILAEVCSWVPEQSYMIRPNVLPLPPLIDIQNGTASLAEAHRRLCLIASLTTEVPWTTSLWTLQEAALRFDAVFYDKRGDPVLHEATQNPITVKHLAKTLNYIYSLIKKDTGMLTEAIDAIERLEQSGTTKAFLHGRLEAFAAVNTIGLHTLISMNAIELLRTSARRKCKRPHDRVYGIMGAIGVKVPVDYSKDPIKVMDMFLVKLHNVLPAEMQGFTRADKEQPRERSWLCDEISDTLTLIRQLEAPPNQPFTKITPTGELVVKELIHISKNGLDDLASRFLARAVLPTFEILAFSELTQGVIRKEDDGNQEHGSYVRMSIALRFVAIKIRLGLIPLGKIKGMERFGWSCMYMLVGRHEDSFPVPDAFNSGRYKRLGVMVLAEELSRDRPTPGEFFIY